MPRKLAVQDRSSSPKRKISGSLSTYALQKASQQGSRLESLDTDYPELFNSNRAKFIEAHGVTDIRHHKGSIIGKVEVSYKDNPGVTVRELTNFGKTMQSTKDVLGY
jgi:hypothetical protein